jgi:MinD-like ATPase involved in chromosome partitioning or flagellar assembly
MAAPEPVETDLTRNLGPGRRLGVVVGIDKYLDQSIPTLASATRDASAMAKLLEQEGRFDDVRILLDAAATRDNVVDHLTRFLNATEPADTVVVFFACHGYDEHLLLYNSVPGSIFATALRMRDLHEVFSNSRAQKVLLVLDVCFSGAVGGRTIPNPESPPPTARIEAQVDAVGSAPGRAILTACKAEELAAEDASGGHFTKCLVEGVRGGSADLSRDHVIELTELYSYLAVAVPNLTHDRQHPVLKANLAGPFPLFLVPEPEPAREPAMLAFIGLHGGVGKSTFVNRGADLVARTVPEARVLLVDLDFGTRQTTLLRAGVDLSCRTMFEYIRDRSDDFDGAMDVTHTVGRSDPIAQRNPLKRSYAETGQVYLIPANRAEEPDFHTIKQIDPADLLRMIEGIVTATVERYGISHVFFDCEAKVDYPSTAAAAHLSKHLFLIGFNQPQDWQQHGAYRAIIRSFYPSFAPEKVHLILNRVPARTHVPIEVFATVPDVGEFGHPEDTMNPFTIRDVLLDDVLFAVFKKALDLETAEVAKKTRVLPEPWLEVLEQVPELERRRSLRIYRAVSRFRVVKVLVIGLTSLVTLGVAIPFWARYGRLTSTLRSLRKGGADWIFQVVEETTSIRRNALNELVAWSRKLSAKGGAT